MHVTPMGKMSAQIVYMYLHYIPCVIIREKILGHEEIAFWQ